VSGGMASATPAAARCDDVSFFFCGDQREVMPTAAMRCDAFDCMSRLEREVPAKST
jgi:hypothetical protein